MFKAHAWIATLIFALAAISGCVRQPGEPGRPPTPPVTRRDPSPIASEVADAVAKVKSSSSGSVGAPIIALEELHTSRAGQIQQAITLVRLRHAHALKQIALEGYVFDGPVLESAWFRASGQTAAQRVAVAVRLLKEGEINSAEFMKLAYDDVELIPIEKTSEYAVEPPARGLTAAATAVYQIALKSALADPTSELEARAEALQRIGRSSPRYPQAQAAFLRSIVNQDSWAKETLRQLHDPKGSEDIKARIALLEGIRTRAKEKGVDVAEVDNQALEGYLSFLNTADQRSRTMVNATAPVADRPGVAVVAMIIGAGHSTGVSQLLGEGGRPHAVLTPLALAEHQSAGDLPGETYQRKTRGLPVYSEGLTGVCLEATLEGQRKPSPVLNQPWFRAKSELYLFTEVIASTGGKGPPGPGGGGPPAGGYQDDDFDGEFVYIDPKTIKPGDAYVVFPAEINRNDPARRKTIWVKARYSTVGHPLDFVPGEEREQTEKMLRDALEEVQAESPGAKQPARVEDRRGRVKITENTIAAFARSEAAVRQTPIPGATT
jgi:hypothetical protein